MGNILMNENQDRILEKFMDIFGPTNLDERFADIKTQHDALQRFSSMEELKLRLGNLICSSMQLASECGWNVDVLIDNTFYHIEEIRSHYESLGRKLNIALMGGSFNPPHKGHVQFAKAILDNSGFIDEVWMMPCNQSRYGKDLVYGEHRIQMCKLAIGNDTRIKVCDWEITNGTGGETYKVMKAFMSEPEFKKYNFYFSIGLDNAYKAPSWVNWPWLEKFARFLIVPRKGVERRDDIDWFKKRPHVCLDEVEVMEASSSDVKKLLENDDPRVYDVMEQVVLRYISAANLYGVGPGKYKEIL
jgi:nicotinate-nucleotide adenylyltransferase